MYLALSATINHDTTTHNTTLQYTHMNMHILTHAGFLLEYVYLNMYTHMCYTHMPKYTQCYSHVNNAEYRQFTL